jgi:large subunit ribosomal protein L29
MRPRDIRRRESADLEQEATRLRTEIFEQRFRGQSEEKADRGAVRRNRKDIARIRTILREREIGIQRGRDERSAGGQGGK